MTNLAIRKILRRVSTAFLLLVTLIAIGYGVVDRTPRSLWLRWLTNDVDGKIAFFGRVVDQSGSPVEGVDILVHIRKFRFSLPGTPWRVIEFNLHTDSHGYFNVVGETGTGLSFYDFKKYGYEYVSPHGETSFNFEQHTTGIFHPDPKTPLIYRMRKKGEETFIVFNEKTPCFDYVRKESGMQKGFDLITGNTIEENDFGHPMAGDVPLICDIKTKADYDPKTNRWKLQIWPGDSDGGILVSREKWYVAPADGYVASYTIDPEAFTKEFHLTPINQSTDPSSDDAAYVYLKSRTPPIYTRFRISTFRIDEHRLSCSAGGFFTNPYGDRNLEPATGLPWEIRSKLDEEVRDCYIHGRRPLKPDLQKWVR